MIGLFRGRKNGMSGELLLLIKWLLIVVGCAYAYAPVGAIVREFSSLSPEWCYRIAYLGAALVIAVVLNKLQTVIGDKLTGSDFFGGAEYYLGMLSGMVRFACMVIFLLAFLNAHIPTTVEVDRVNNRTEDLGPAQVNPLKIERQILMSSYTGQFVREHMSKLLIAPVTLASEKPDKAKADTIAAKKERMMDEIIGTPAKQ